MGRESDRMVVVEMVDYDSGRGWRHDTNNDEKGLLLRLIVREAEFYQTPRVPLGICVGVCV